ncbi:hypothetical protein BK767_18155 [Bacillus thuringiensis serovar kyushuensis]|uniref:RICIN domain-containing protein n=1 Tax=Bacillus thuringiensis TaxID=1428 RepID=UPI000B43894D|nr:RICIN domain-containing protein [Bacillus thuringiensis]MEC2866600.1 RICIN domain-containing protein [Bacillus cereus]OTZ68984.1 hypothetical protein BK768_23335 [Bacillus thuringiensis serovar tohokuensis]OTZ69777.1 hypothetical protein BK767_18155 [Bacillus thuringiensis serovar kyushuensis]
MNSPKKNLKHNNFLELIKNKILYIVNPENQNQNPGFIYLQPSSASSEDVTLSTKDVTVDGEEFESEIHWIIYPLDGGQYIIANLDHGKVLSMTDSEYEDLHDSSIELEEYTGNPNQHWSFETNEENISYYVIRNIRYGYLIGYGYPFKPYVVPTPNEIRKNPNNLLLNWTFEESKNIYIPSNPTIETLDSFPKLTSENYNRQLPDQTPRRLTGWTTLPAPLVKDGHRTLKQQLQDTPYYVLEKYQYWKKLRQTALEGQQSDTQQIKYEQTDTTSQTIAQTTGITVTKDAGFSFGLGSILGGSGSIRQQITNNLNVSESQTTEVRIDTENTDEYHNPFNSVLYYAKYILMTELVLKRPAQNNQDNDIEISRYIYNDPNTVQTSAYSKEQEEQATGIVMSKVSIPTTQNSDIQCK